MMIRSVEIENNENVGNSDNYRSSRRFAQLTDVDCDSRATMEAILTRDQRTTSHRVTDMRPQIRNGNSFPSPVTSPVASPDTRKTFPAFYLSLLRSFVTELSNATRSSRTRNVDHHGERRRRSTNRCIRKRIRRCRSPAGSTGVTTTWTRLASLLVTLLVASINAAPTMNAEDKRLSSTPKWMNPCGLTQPIDGDSDVVQLDDKLLVSQISIQSADALFHTERFRDEYAETTFGMSLAELHATWKKQRYDWLPGPKEIPKGLNESLKKEYLDSLQLDAALLDVYEYMQKYAVGLEQIVWDQEDRKLKFRGNFSEAEYKLRSVLCEIQVALVERGVKQRPDVQRSVMSDTYRYMSNDTHRNLRDWLIFRDYMNGIQYVREVFNHFHEVLGS